ncbi:MAG: rod shape-determining protein MreC [Gaiellaceae bacterium]|nr:rod shape-determining protein MreC [Gaiellaceae bacterium]
MPRNRTVRLAVLGSSVQRGSSPSFPSRTGSALRRRVVLGVLVLVSLVLITVYFRESTGGSLHRAQGAGSTVLHPFEVAANRVARPFRDAYGYFDGLFRAKRENAQLRQRVQELEQNYAQSYGALAEVKRLRDLLRFSEAPSFPQDYTQVNVSVLSAPQSDFEQTVVIAAGSNRGIHENDPVASASGLVGVVGNVQRDTAQVRLLTDPTIKVTAIDVGTHAIGIVQAGSAGSGALAFNLVPKAKEVRQGDYIVTAGSQSGELPSLFPHGIKIGRVQFVSQNNVDYFKVVQVKPFADFTSLDALAVLIRKPAAKP